MTRLSAVEFAFAEYSVEETAAWCSQNELLSLSAVPSLRVQTSKLEPHTLSFETRNPWAEVGLLVESIQGFFFGAPHNLLISDLMTSEADSYFSAARDSAESLGAKFLIVGAPYLRSSEEVDSKTAFFRSMERFANSLSGTGLKVLVENLPLQKGEVLFGSPSSIFSLSDAGVGLCLDLGNLSTISSLQGWRSEEFRVELLESISRSDQIQLNLDLWDWNAGFETIFELESELEGLFLESKQTSSILSFLAAWRSRPHLSSHSQPIEDVG